MAKSDASDADRARLQAEAVAVCEREDIRRPARIQAFGCLVAVDEDGRVAGVSANAQAMLGRPIALGAALRETFGLDAETARTLLAAAKAVSRPALLASGVLPAVLDRRFEVFGHGAAGNAVVEFIPREAEAPAPSLPPPGDEDDVFRQCLARAERVRTLTGYDRVMVYRFHPDFTGEVIAEVRQPELPPYLGLRYPATDIPSQARALYLENRARIIPNIYAPTAAILAEAPIDLSVAQLRAVSPYHIEYLHNMQVAATLTLSIVVEGALWGLVACHHARERMLSPARQAAALTEAEALGAAIAALERRERKAARGALQGQRRRWKARLGGARVAEPLLSGVDSIVAELKADGGAIVCGDAWLGVGVTPDGAWLVAAADRVGQAQDGCEITDRLLDLEHLPPSAAVAGAMIARVQADPPTTLLVFRRAQVQEVHWGGDPKAAVLISPIDGRPSPRQSFALWRELVGDRARPWTELEREVFAVCRESLSARLGADAGAAGRLRDELGEVAKTYAKMADSHRLLVDALPEGVAVLLWSVQDRGARLLYANRAFTNLFGLELADVVGHRPERILERTHLDRRVLDASDPNENEMDVWSSSLGVRRVRARREALVRYRGPAGKVDIESLLLSDTTGASRSHEALLSAVRQAQVAEKARGALLRNMSHELRTPLNAILGYSDMIAQELVGPLGADAYRSAAEEIRDAARHLLALINDTLEMSRLNEGKARIEAGRHDLGEIVESVTRLLSALAASRRIDLVTRLPPTPLHATVDDQAFRQVVINLVNNAIKFTPEGGRAEVALGLDPDGAVLLSVADTGIGIPAGEFDRLFVPFSQVDSTLRRNTGGTGLGLAIVKELVQLHGGKIDLTSREGQGSTFSVRLPAWRVEGRI